MRLIINSTEITFDTSDRRIVGADLDFDIGVNIDDTNLINHSSLVINSRTAELDMITGWFDFADVEIYEDSGVLLLKGRIFQVEYSKGGYITLTLRRKIDLDLSSDFTLSGVDQNPVDVIKAILEDAGAIVDTASYDAAAALFQGAGEILCNVSWMWYDLASRRDAVNLMCQMFNIFVYPQGDRWYIWDLKTHSGVGELNPSQVSQILFVNSSPEYTRAVVEWEGGVSKEEVDGDIDTYGIIEREFNVSEPAVVVLNNIDYVQRTFTRRMNFRGRLQQKISFVSQVKLDLSMLYRYSTDTLTIYFRPTKRRQQAVNYEYEGILWV